jgi:hypothetical protein
MTYADLPAEVKDEIWNKNSSHAIDQAVLGNNQLNGQRGN